MKGKNEKTVWDIAAASVKGRIEEALKEEGKTLGDAGGVGGGNFTRRMYSQIKGDTTLSLSAFLAVSDILEKTSNEYLLYGRGRRDKNIDDGEEISRLQMENDTLRRRVEELESNKRRLEKIINKLIGEDDN